MKLKKPISLLICLATIITTFVEQDTTDENNEDSFDFEETLADSLGLDYVAHENGYSVTKGNTTSSVTYDDNGNVTNISALKTNNKNKKAAYSSSLVVDTNLEYDASNKLTSISTINQDISITRDGDVIEEIELNDKVLFQSVSNGDETVQKFINGTEIITTEESLNNYTIEYGDVSSFSIEVDDNSQLPSKIVDENTGEISHYAYNDDEILISLENANGKIVNDSDSFVNSFYGGSLNIEKDENLFKLNLGNETYLIEQYDEAEEGNYLLLNGEKVFSYYKKEDLSEEESYFDILGNEETYLYDDLGYLISVSNEEETKKKYDYDDFGKLIYSYNGGVEHFYNYDDSGNLLLEETNGLITTYGFENEENLNQLTSINGEKLEYDDFGNLTKYSNDAYVWDAGQLLVESFVSDVESTYEYDADKIRTKRIVNDNQIHEYQYFDGHLVASKNNDDVVNYFYDNEYNALGFVFNNNLYLYVKDSLGVIKGIVNENLEPVVIYEYDDWGSPNITYSSSNAVANANELIYKDYVYDKETNLYYLGSRYYSPLMRRFISQDSLEKVAEAGSNDYNYNLYSYCQNNPIMCSDKFGYEALTIALTAVVIVIACVFILITVNLIVNLLINAFSSNKTLKSAVPNISSSLSKNKSYLTQVVKIIKNAALSAFTSYVALLWMFWKNTRNKTEDHHVIAQAAAKAKPARDIFCTKYGHEIDEDINMVPITYEFHRRLHTNAYYSAVNVYIEAGDSWGKEIGVLVNLVIIRDALEALNSAMLSS